MPSSMLSNRLTRAFATFVSTAGPAIHDIKPMVPSLRKSPLTQLDLQTIGLLSLCAAEVLCSCGTMYLITKFDGYMRGLLDKRRRMIREELDWSQRSSMRRERQSMK